MPRPAGADDEAATAQTIAAMYEYSSADADDPQVQAIAADVTAGRRDQLAQLAAVFAWLRQTLEYVEDKSLAYFRPNAADAEVLIRPADLVRMQHPQGDCDEYSMCARSLLLACGIPAEFVTVEADADAPGAYSHVYAMAHARAGAVPFDAIPATRHGLGYEVQPTGKRRVWPAPSVPMLRTNTQAIHGRPSTTFTRLQRPAPAALTPTEILPALAPRSLGQLGDDSADSADGGFDWNDFSSSLLKDASGILGQRYGVPQLNPGQVIRKADGTVLYQAAPGQASTSPFGSNLFGGSTNSSGLMILAVAGIGLALILGRK